MSYAWRNTFMIGDIVWAPTGNQLTGIILPLYTAYLLLDKKIPFIKIQLLRDNPANIDLSDIRELLKNHYTVPVVSK